MHVAPFARLRPSFVSPASVFPVPSVVGIRHLCSQRVVRFCVGVDHRLSAEASWDHCRWGSGARWAVHPRQTWGPGVGFPGGLDPRALPVEGSAGDRDVRRQPRVLRSSSSLHVAAGHPSAHTASFSHAYAMQAMWAFSENALRSCGDPGAEILLRSY